MREFTTGATRDTDTAKLDYEGFLCPRVLERYATYMHKNRLQADGKLRSSDNWQKGIPIEAYMKSKWRHFMDTWKAYRNPAVPIDMEESLCAELFNTMGLLHELLKARAGTEVDPIDLARRIAAQRETHNGESKTE